ncbi:S1 family peptidase [Saccharothrix algeriensis]|uniref:Trypsin-like peptidase domain-containing protein n=1 Tax=Saccharothrix algeriensis TaxID=173560 RepID=A0A8T8HUL8_9PSEU|nr:serine protease [Saccharothrix algeriensis]MBM7813728.1 V8-like Glu-specific endopeptidase [Saccharothrix algeriensis]QTR02192.1 trypsin-like peptidase domain-containing protein [Saccharothrix algeriensis]
MAKRLPGAVLATVLFLTVLVAPARAAEPTAVDFTGIVALNNCSGSVVRTPTAQPSDRALVLTNGHCVKLMADREVLVDQAADRAFTLLERSGKGTLGTLRAERLLYATMTGTDAALYRLTTTYEQVEGMGTRALTLSPQHPTAGIDIRVVSGYWQKIYSCRADGFVHQLREGAWTWNDSIRYTASCDIIGGTSGSPVVDVASGAVVGVNNTGNESGGRCTTNNPCEVDPTGTITVRPGIGYAQQTYQIVPCLPGGGRIDLHAPGCGLARP